MNRAGTYTTNMTGEAAYQSFRPAPLPPAPALNMDNDLIRLLVSANRQLVYLDTASKLIPNTELFVSMYVRKEALISSQIEGTQCTLDDVLDPESESGRIRSYQLRSGVTVCTGAAAIASALQSSSPRNTCHLDGRRAGAGKESRGIPSFSKLDRRCKLHVKGCTLYPAQCE